jgi:hypothetical protein
MANWDGKKKIVYLASSSLLFDKRAAAVPEIMDDYLYI